jgi:hypothetical protein
MVKILLLWLRIFLMLDLWFLIQLISNKKNQIIRIQSRSGLYEEKIYYKLEFFLNMN